MSSRSIDLNKFKTSSSWTPSNSNLVRLTSSDSNLSNFAPRTHLISSANFAPIMAEKAQQYNPSSINNVVSIALREMAEDQITVRMENLLMGDDIFKRMTKLIQNAKVLSETEPQIKQVIEWNQLVTEFNIQNDIVVLATKTRPYLKVPLEHNKLISELIVWTTNVNKHMNSHSEIGTVGTGNKLEKLGALTSCLKLVSVLGMLDKSTDVGKAQAEKHFKSEVKYSKNSTGFNRTNCYLSEPQIFAAYIQKALNAEPGILKINGVAPISFRELMVGMSSKMTKHAFEDIYDNVRKLLHVKSIKDADPISVPPWMMTPNKLKTSSVYNDSDNPVHFITDIPYLNIQGMMKLRAVLDVIIKKPIGADSYSVSSAVYGFIGGRGFLSHQMAEDIISKMHISHEDRPGQFPIEIGQVKNDEWRAKHLPLNDSGKAIPNILKRIPASLLPIKDGSDAGLEY